MAVHYDFRLLFLLTLVVGLNVLDSLFTLMILSEGGKEANPVIQAVMDVYGDRFWIWKFLIVSVNVILLCLHSHFRYVEKIIFWVTILFLLVVTYQVILLKFYIF